MPTATAPVTPGANDSQQRIATLDGWVLHLAIFLVACAVVIARRPDPIFHAQFYAEDGRFWFGDAYNLGWWEALFRTQVGYLQTFPRLGATVSLLLPFSLAPLVVNIIAIAIQALPANILLSARSAGWGSLRLRAILAAFYLALPNNQEMSVGITNSQWILALCAFLLLVAFPPQGRFAKAFDISIFTLSGLTGPFCILLLPIAAFLKRKIPLGILAAASLIQGLELLTHPGNRSTAALGANPEWFIRLLSGQVFLSTVFGASPIGSLDAPYLFPFFVGVAVIGILLVVACVREAPLNMKLFLLLAAMVLAASLKSPLIDPRDGKTIWQELAAVPGQRYWFFPALAFAWSLLWCTRSRSEAVRIVSRVLLVLMCIGLVRDWRRPAFKDMAFAAYARKFQDAPRGTVITIPLNPPGWDMRLIKH